MERKNKIKESDILYKDLLKILRDTYHLNDDAINDITYLIKKIILLKQKEALEVYNGINKNE